MALANDTPAALELVCAHCDGVVRVPEQRLQDDPKCPRCHRPLLDGEPLELTEANFDRHIGRSALPVVVDFWAPWCGPCRAMAPAFKEAAAGMATEARFAKLNTDEAQQVAARYGIRSIPTVMVFLHGREIARQAGAMSAATLRNWVGSALAKGR